ncbi:hypothetical protein [Saccharopolyspora gloriosae]|uniref:hypothetical protein n=1 Tax=Saccharopolyspora gloriosae TaxID=455344 RepID=UPI001FB768B5|nr:hypothetical protein [Saccharopolyspora gloriosae]
MTVDHSRNISQDPRLVDDDATRHLSAAAHAHDDFADELVEEFLAEPRRAVPPSPGLNPVAVLSEALATRRRRVVRDSLVVGLFLVVLVTWWWLAVPWLLAVGSGVFVHSLVRRISTRRGRKRISGAGWMLILFGAYLGSIVGSSLALLGGLAFGDSDALWSAAGLGGSDYYDYYDYYDSGETSGGSGAPMFLIGLLASLGLLAVLLVDRVRVHLALTTRFEPSRYWNGGQHLPPSPVGAWYTERLHHIARAAATSNTLVHDGYDPFVGAGERVHAWSIAVPLRAVDDAEVTLSRADVHAGVRAGVLALRGSAELSPGGRLRDLQESQEVVTSAVALLRQAGDPIGRAILPDPGAPPNSALDPAVIAEIVQNSPEWVRPYLCFRVEGWSKELVVSTFLHVACDDKMLYLEWKAYVLNPIRPEYRYEQLKLLRADYAVMRGFVDAVLVPASLGRRVLRLWRAARDGRKPMGGGYYDLPGRYGARRGIRELAADDAGTTYFHDEDSVRYVKLLERRTLAAVGRTLTEHGLKTDEFTSQSSTITHSTVINGGTFSGVNVVGQGNQASTGGLGGERE